jgi:hypothetical protein
VALVLLDHHCTLGYGAQLLRLLYQYLTG